MLKFFGPKDPDDWRWHRRRRVALWTLGLSSPFLLAGGYVLLLLAAQPDHREPLWADGMELQSIRWIPAPPRTLEVKVRFYRKDGRAGKYPQRMWLQTLGGMRYRLDGEPKTTITTQGNEATLTLIHTLYKNMPPMKHQVVSLLAEDRELTPPDPFAIVRWLPGMPEPRGTIGHRFEIAPRLTLPPEPGL
jgi:hypothetical protein